MKTPATDPAEVTRRIIADFTTGDIEKVTAFASFNDDLGCDSLDKIEILMSVEEEFHIEISEAEGDAVFDAGNVGALLDLVRKKTA